MKAYSLLENLEFHDKNPYAEPLLVNENSRILRFTLRPGQEVREHDAPHSPVHIIVLKGTGKIAGPDGIEQEYGPNELLTFEPGEKHTARALDEDFVFIAFLHEAPR
jgi:quercetin dioxygenase-like cupin family protein